MHSTTHLATGERGRSKGMAMVATQEIRGRRGYQVTVNQRQVNTVLLASSKDDRPQHPHPMADRRTQLQTMAAINHTTLAVSRLILLEERDRCGEVIALVPRYYY